MTTPLISRTYQLNADAAQPSLTLVGFIDDISSADAQNSEKRVIHIANLAIEVHSKVIQSLDNLKINDWVSVSAQWDEVAQVWRGASATAVLLQVVPSNERTKEPSPPPSKPTQANTNTAIKTGFNQLVTGFNLSASRPATPPLSTSVNKPTPSAPMAPLVLAPATKAPAIPRPTQTSAQKAPLSFNPSAATKQKTTNTAPVATSPRTQAQSPKGGKPVFALRVASSPAPSKPATAAAGGFRAGSAASVIGASGPSKGGFSKASAQPEGENAASEANERFSDPYWEKRHSNARDEEDDIPY